MSEQQDLYAELTEFPHVDLRIIYVLVMLLLCLGVVIGLERGVEIPLSAKIVGAFAVVSCIYAFRKAGKFVFALRDDHLEITDGTKIPYTAITSVKMTNAMADIRYTGDDESEHKAVILFGNVRISLKDEARKTLRKRLEQHGITIDS